MPPEIAKTANIKVDYIFTGSRFFDANPEVLSDTLKQTRKTYQVLDEIKISDHHPIVISLPEKSVQLTCKLDPAISNKASVCSSFQIYGTASQPFS